MATQATQKFLSDLSKEMDLKTGQLNIINSPCGSGKTTFIFQDIETHCFPNIENAIILIDTCAARDSLLLDDLKAKDKNKLRLIDSVEDSFEIHKIPIMTYHKFGLLIKTNPSIFNQTTRIYCDEFHQLKKYLGIESQQTKNHFCKNALLGLESFVRENKKTIIALSATPKSIFSFFKEKTVLSLSEKQIASLKQLETKDVKSFVNLSKIPDGKGIVFVEKISQQKKLFHFFEQQGKKAIYIFSPNSQTEQMTEEQILVREFLLKEHCFPKQYDILIINSAYETSINIYDTIRVDFMIIFSTNKDTIIQVRGRYRAKLSLLLLKQQQQENDLIFLQEKYLEKILVKEDLKKIISELNLTDSRNRQIGTTTFLQLLNSQKQYFIIKYERPSRWIFKKMQE